MKTYEIKHLDPSAPVAEDEYGKAFGIPAGLNDAKIDFFVQTPETFRPLCGCRMGWDENGLYVWEYALETELRMEEVGTCSHAWWDSCLEVFMAPNIEKPDLYFNYECTPAPYVYLSKGTGRPDRQEFHILPDGMEPSSLILPGYGWSIRYRIPLDFMRDEFGVTGLHEGLEMRANFQKCGDKTKTPHWALWNEMTPGENGGYDFHRPQFFGRLILR